MLARLKRILELSRYPIEKLDATEFILEKEAIKPDGEASGAFLEDMTDSEYAEWERDNDHGWAKFKEQLKEALTVKTDHDLTA